MSTSEKIKEFIRSKFYEIETRKYTYNSVKNELTRKAEDIKNGGNFWIDLIYRDCVDFTKLHNEIMIMEIDLSQFVHVLGDEYVAYYESLKGTGE